MTTQLPGHFGGNVVKGLVVGPKADRTRTAAALTSAEQRSLVGRPLRSVVDLTAIRQRSVSKHFDSWISRLRMALARVDHIPLKPGKLL